MRINALSVEKVLDILVTSIDGLSEEEAQRRLHEFGHNEIEQIEKRPLIYKFLEQFIHFLAILLWIGALLCFLSEYLFPGEGMATLGIAIIAVILINGIFTFIQEYRAEKVLNAMKKLLPFRAKVIREGRLREIDARELVIGDLVVLSEGDRVPADIRLIEEEGLTVNNAALTGEAEPLLRTEEPFDGELIQSPNILFAGTTVLSGNGKGVVFATGMRTEFGKIAHLAGTVESGLSPLQLEIKRITRIVGFIATLMGLFFFLTGYLTGRNFLENLLFAIGIIVANVPEGLLPTVTLSLAMGSQRMARKKALIKKLTAVEALGSVDIICTDKTGTLTENRMEVKKVIDWNEGMETPFPSLRDIASLCNDARLIDNELKGNPTDVALLRFAGSVPESERLGGFPFTPERKRVSTINRIKERLFVLSKGAPESILEVSRYCLIRGEVQEITEEIRRKVVKEWESLMEQGLRVIAFAFREIKEGIPEKEEEAEKELVFTGLAGLEDPPRPEVPEAIERCKRAGIKIVMITGDSPKTALATARQIGLAHEKVRIIEDKEFVNLKDSELREIMNKEDVIFARMTPRYKLRIVSILKESGHRVAVTGDGVNDAPALKKADIGIAMGSGTDVAKESADIVLLDDNFATIVNAIEEGRAVFENIRNFITYIFSSNIPEIVPYIAYVIFRIPLPLNIMQILAVDLGTDLFPALALGAERPSPEIMKRPPRRPEERLLSWQVLRRAYFFLGPIEAVAGLYGYFYVLNSGGWFWGEALSSRDVLYLQATTACLAGIIVTQIANVFVSRSATEPALRLGLFSNRLILIAICLELLLAFVFIYTPVGNLFFGTSPLSLEVWLRLMPFALVLFVMDETRKICIKR
jgi:sodium/potassium-transporting ATPase subunit alpha